MAEKEDTRGQGRFHALAAGKSSNIPGMKSVEQNVILLYTFSSGGLSALKLRYSTRS